MNKRIKKKKDTIWRINNRKKLIKRYPFLIPRTHWYSGKFLTKKQRKQSIKGCLSIYDDIPIGWVKTLFLPLCEELREELIRCNFMDDFYILQAKEKYAGLRVYTGHYKGHIQEIISNYEYVSEAVCQRCGDIENSFVIGQHWLICLCKNCAEKINELDTWNRELEACKREKIEPFGIPNKRKYLIGTADGWKDCIVDISKTKVLIENNYYHKNLVKQLKLKGEWWK